MGARREAREALAAAGLHPRRRFGQHFLCDRGVVQRIVDAAAVGPTSTVLEIGPGLGALTDTLAARAGRLYLVEIDRALAARLVERHAATSHVTVLEGDVLELGLDTLVPEDDVTVVGNLPYNISTPILFRLLALRARFPRAVVMLQREVAVRMTSKPGSKDWGILAVMLQTFAEIRVAFGVSRRSFLPPPTVESAVVVVNWRATPRADIGSVDTYRAVVRGAFGQRRKMLRNALAAEAEARGVDVEAVLTGAGIDPRARAETLTLDDFARLSRTIDPG
ncbi:MAG TPA: 16S rRNA (adenine(1518)-N(6)/adenine(1519)-N(6))-dimethyltransferase RsmA [Candidatus Binatia bacterium]|jgi:16S rRNA (adenine1518-N6/adenine1519-N6)-dimethyltransferase|nr:16S rRNA (adenine(1518)-N(6)/adenine(1519)-N(6))-dimethyltransferase RsmA [Candidatus Binatia bacterium]